MQNVFFLLLTFSCFFGCQSNNNKVDATINSSDSTKLRSQNEIKKSLRIPSKKVQPSEKFNALPLLATYINELPFYQNEFPLNEAAERLAFRADSVYFLEGEEDGDYSYYYELNFCTQKQVQFIGGWSGTAGDQNWVANYQLLDDHQKRPTVLLTVQSKETFGGYAENLESNYLDLKKMIAEGNTKIPTDENVLVQIAEKMTQVGRYKGSLNDSYNLHQLRFWVWQKQGDEWKNISKDVFNPTMYKDLETSFPFLAQDQVATPSIPGFFLQEQFYSEEGVAQNKEHFKAWLGVNDPLETSFKLTVNPDNIQFECSKNKTIQWDWNGKEYTLNDLNSHIQWQDQPCSLIDYSSDKQYIFAGNIGNIPIKMSVRLDQGKIRGTYWYSNKPNSIFPIEGNFTPSTEADLNFYRIKNNQEREAFSCYFNNCEFKGWWQHQETMSIEEFTLKLVSE